MALPNTPSKTWTFFQGDWHEGNIPIMGARTHAAWLGSSVFDGARIFEGVGPDSTDEQFAAVVSRHPAFEVLPAT